MTEGNFIVPARSWSSISAQAEHVRRTLGLQDCTYLPITNILEALPDLLEGFEFLVREDAEMGGALGVTAPDGSFIALGETVYRRACDGHARDRFTAAHELGHLILHKGTSFQRADGAQATPAYRLSEPQANFFAAMILMPRKFIQPAHGVSDLVDMFGVSQGAARNRLERMAWSGL